ncbi:MAG TPA: nucleoside phosphorylase [Ktedonobacteraceae bacterium]|nr:nucleoside phosphorylase [Ktedonobacteraceae bacterium]
MNLDDNTPILERKAYEQPSVFTAENLLREARRQKKLVQGKVPALCVLDPDGDLLDYLREHNRAQIHATWACYHTTLYTVTQDGWEFGLIGRVVGASFAVLVAEELFVSGCKLLVSITSAGQLLAIDQPPYVVLIERALRDEGTSYHYLPPAAYSALSPMLRERVVELWDQTQLPLYAGSSWTTDAPFRETEAMLAWGREQGILAIEMEAAALYALATARQYPIVCFAHITNQMAQAEGDFEKGPANGSETALEIIRQMRQI